MPRAEDLYERLRNAGLAALAELLATRQSEFLFLDFKRSADNGGGARLSQADRDNLSRAVSGFGNSEGGVIVWGIECKDLDGEGDFARDAVPITKPDRFKAWLEGAVSGVTLPPHTLVQNHAISGTTPDTGFVVTLVPKCPAAPLQATAKNYYYVRAGSSFVPAPHGLLRGMFGHPDPPQLRHRWRASGAKLIPMAGAPRAIELSMDLWLTNLGPGIARDLFVNLTFEPLGQSCIMDVTPVSRVWQAFSPTPLEHSLVSDDGFKLAPEATVTALNLKLTLGPPFSWDGGYILSYGHGTAPLFKRAIPLSVEAIAALFDRLLPTTPDRINDGGFLSAFLPLWALDAV